MSSHADVLRLPAFEVVEPTSVGEAVELLARHGARARPMAGGTDLLPNMKHGITTPDIVVGLWRIPELDRVWIDGDRIRIGALCTLHDLAENPIVTQHLPSLRDAASEIAGPQLRRMGTIGGNVCLDTRCAYINQTHFWRKALGYCLKRDGTVCHVVEGGRRCVAAASNDTAPVLITLGARLSIRGGSGSREIAIADFFENDGVWNQGRASSELVTEISMAMPRPDTKMAYAKLRTREAIDFPELGVAVTVRVDAHGFADDVEVCVTALAARPKRIDGIEALYRGRVFDQKVIDAIADEAHRRCKPLANIASDPTYRREMVRVFVRRAFHRALERSPMG